MSVNYAKGDSMKTILMSVLAAAALQAQAQSAPIRCTALKRVVETNGSATETRVPLATVLDIGGNLVMEAEIGAYSFSLSRSEEDTGYLTGISRGPEYTTGINSKGQFVQGRLQLSWVERETLHKLECHR